MKLCMGCMNQIDDNVMTCPHCGFNESTYKQESYYLNPGTIVGGKYIIGKVLKYGGHTVSYLGMDAEVNRKVIIKEYLPSDFSTRSEGETEITIYSGDAKEQFEIGLTNFLNEANVIQGLGSSEGIAKVYDCLAENDTGYVVSEYVQGKSLKDVLSSRRKYSVSEAKTIIEKLLKGLSKVHMQNIVHCDISPETIMISDNGEVKLVDFGATRYVTTSNSKSLAIILKQGYAAEEQYRSSGRRGPWTDVYAVAAVMYRMITGITPQEAVERALADEIKSPSKLGVSIEVNIENALMNALNVYKNERTPNAQVFLQELNSSSVKRIKTQKKSNDTGKFPVWAKALVACLLCAVIVAGTIFVIKGDSGTDELGSDEVVWKEYSGDTIEDVQKYLSANGHDMNIVEEIVYDKDESNDGKIAECPLTKDVVEKAKDDADMQKTLGIKIDEKRHVSGTMTCKVYSSKKISYKELSDLNAFSLSRKMGINTSDDIFEPDREQDNAKEILYFDFEEIIKKDGSKITRSDINKNYNESDYIEIDDISKIIFYAGDFFCWLSKDGGLPKFETLSIDGDREKFKFKTYEKTDEKSDPEQTNNEKYLCDDENLCDKAFYSINYNEGYVFKQTIPPKESFDVTKDLDKLDKNGKLLYIVGESFNKMVQDGVIGNDLKNELDTYLAGRNSNVEIVAGDSNQLVKEVHIFNKDGEELVAAKQDDEVTIKITCKEKVVQQESTGNNGTNENEHLEGVN